MIPPKNPNRIRTEFSAELVPGRILRRWRAERDFNVGSYDRSSAGGFYASRNAVNRRDRWQQPIFFLGCKILYSQLCCHFMYAKLSLWLYVQKNACRRQRAAGNARPPPPLEVNRKSLSGRRIVIDKKLRRAREENQSPRVSSVRRVFHHLHVYLRRRAAFVIGLTNTRGALAGKSTPDHAAFIANQVN